MSPVITAVIALVCLWFPVAYVLGAARVGRRGGIKDRLGVVDGLATAVVGIVLARLLLPWSLVPWSPGAALLWAVPVALAAYGTMLAVRAWSALPWVTGRAPALRVAGTTIGAAITAALAIAGA